MLKRVSEDGKVDEDADEEFDETSKEEYLDIANRGGLTKPSDVLYMTCVHAYALYLHLESNATAWKLLLESSNTRSVFVSCFVEKMRHPHCGSIYHATCSKGCKLNVHFPTIAAMSFNLKAKNFVAQKNDEINKLKRAAAANPKKSAAAKKIMKLTSA